MTVQTEEIRPFEARFGDRCPFCGKSWGDPSPCGDSRWDRSIADSLRLIFADRIRFCRVCETQIPSSTRVCDGCRRPLNRPGNRHRWIEKVCVIPGCGQRFETQKKDQRVCSRSCGMRARHMARARGRAEELAA